MSQADLKGSEIVTHLASLPDDILGNILANLDLLDRSAAPCVTLFFAHLFPVR